MDERPDEVRERAARSADPTPEERREMEERARSDDEVEATRARIEQTRAEMSETVDELQERLDPNRLKEQARTRASDTARNAGSQALETLRQNPVPVAIIGGLLGLAILGRLLSGGGKERRGSDTVVFDLRRGKVRGT
jgi:anti-sigma factor RsiW